MSTKKIYICGKISDRSKAKVKRNLGFFHLKEKELAAKGYDVLNPAKWDVESAWEWCLVRDLYLLMTEQPDMYFMTGWEDSRGARLEHEMAILLGLDITYEK